MICSVGGAITHAALLDGKYKNIYYNDIQKGLTQLFKDAVEGKYTNETRWISREDFEKLKDTDLFIAYCWSFGNGGSAYMYGKNIEEYKHGIHNAVFFQDYNILRKYDIDFESDKETIKERKSDYNKYIKDNKTRLRQLWKEKYEKLAKEGPENNLRQLQSLERLQSLQSLQISNKSYDEIEIKENSIIYCDIPYKDTAGYTSGDFDYDKFYDWCEKQTVPVYISEYWMPPDRFDIVAEKTITRKLSAVSANKCNEKIFTVKKTTA